MAWEIKLKIEILKMVIKITSSTEIINGNAEFITAEICNKNNIKIHCSNLDPPFNKDKFYRKYKDNLPENEYWTFMEDICKNIFKMTVPGGYIFFMQRSENEDKVKNTLENSGFTYQNTITWKKMTSPPPIKHKLAPAKQIIVVATRGMKARLYNPLRIDVAPPLNYQVSNPKGVTINDVWDDIRELTSGFFAGTEPIRMSENKDICFEYKMNQIKELKLKRFHLQQAPIALLTRIILLSTKPGDLVYDPFGGTGTTSVVCQQLDRNCIIVEIDELNIKCIKERMRINRVEDSLIHREYSFGKKIEMDLLKKGLNSLNNFKRLLKEKKLSTPILKKELNSEKWNLNQIFIDHKMTLKDYYRFTPGIENIWSDRLNIVKVPNLKLDATSRPIENLESLSPLIISGKNKKNLEAFF
ncbi:MAG: hypothetical protein EAX96_06595 [Candidatus Lokiarchaeota archaeon]|nr:hypothetical protein [Candidatus Lokiarchaeota archaeon]